MYQGSSPRMRGARLGDGLAVAVPGIIPAYAGSTRRRAPVSPPRWDHPRVCGEHALSVAVSGRPAGSSPRMRGALVEELLFVVDEGIIPAYAGSTINRINVDGDE